MRARICFIFLIAFAVASYGCTTTAVIVGGAVAAGAIALTHDSATTSVDTSFNNAWKVANERLKKIGDVDESHHKLGEIRAKVNNADIKVRISRLTERTVDIKVSARRNFLPDLDLARSILANIMRHL